MSRETQSVLMGYAININLDGMAFDEVWDDFIDSKQDGVRCSDVLHFAIPPNELARMLRKGDLRTVLDEMRKLGANFVFVGPVVGKPIDGLGI
jgi:hypothetical protein